MTELHIGQTASGAPIALQLRYANRHGLVTGATGTGKTTTLQRLAEGFSRAGVPVFAADIKGDLSGIGAASDRGRGCPLALWDIFGRHGLPIRTSVTEMGGQLLSSMLGLNDVQSGTIDILFRRSENEQEWPQSLDDLRWHLHDMLEHREEVAARYGNVTGSSLAAIQRSILALEAQGGHNLFGEPPFDILDLIRLERGEGVVSLLHADQLLEAPRAYAILLLWMLTELFRRLPEVGDLEKPKLVFFFDEAHLLFRDAPKPLLQQIERLVRLVRSKGVGVYLVTQSPLDVPEAVLAQLANRVQHALRAFTPKDQRMIRAAAQAFRPNPPLDVRSALTQMAVGEALVSVMEADGVPSPVERVRMALPGSQIGPISELERSAAIENSPLYARYAARLDGPVAAHTFDTRMRLKRGLAAKPAPSGEPWREGDALAFVPKFEPSARKQRQTVGVWPAAPAGGLALLLWLTM